MKKIIFVYILMNFSLLAFSQAIHIFHDGEKTPDIVANAGIDSIYFAPKFEESTEYQQVFVTADGEKRYDIVDSVKFNLPYMVAKRHIGYVPNEYGYIKVPVYCSFGDSPILILPDGSFLTVIDGEGRRGNEYCEFSKRVEANNGLGVSDVRSEIWHLVSGEMQDSIVLIYSGLPVANNRYTGICFTNEENEYTIDTNFPNTTLNINMDGVDWYYNEEGKPVIHFSRNESGEKRSINFSLSVGFYREAENWMNQLGKPFMHTSEEHMAALQEFCDATDFDNWGEKTNWWSDEPLWKWDYKLNGDREGYFWHINDHVVQLCFGGGQYTGVHGTLPASFEVFMDDADGELDLTCCALYGTIPYNIRHNKNWSKYGWNFIQQDPWFGGGFDMEDINLRMKDEEIMYVDGTKSTAYEELAKHKLTFVSVGAPSEAFCNLCLDYANKGFEYIYVCGHVAC